MKSGYLSLAIIFMCGTTASAQTETAPADSVIWQALADNAPEACTPDEVPALHYITPNRTIALYVSGQLKATVGYDINHSLDDPNNFTSLDIPVDNAPGNRGKFQMSGQQSALSLNMVALPGSKNQVGLFFTGNLLGDGYTPAVEYALVKFRGFTAGLGYTLFSDTPAALPTIDYMGPCGYTGAGNAGVQYHVSLGKGLSIGAAIEIPLASYTAGSDASFIHQRVPDIPVAVKYAWGGGDSWIRAAAVIRNMMYHDLVADRDHDNVGWGVQLSGSQVIGGPLRLMWQATYGKGITSYFQDYTDHGYDMMPDPTHPGRLKNVEAWGGYAGIQCNFSENVYMCAGYSQVHDYIDRYTIGASDDEDCTPWADQSKYTQYAVANLFWDINSFVSCGVEYIWGCRMNFDHNAGRDTRVQAMLQFSF